MKSHAILVTGATGYVGGRLVPRLLAAGHRVRVMARSRAKLESRPWAGHPNIELVEANVLDPPALGRALAGMEVVYYLVHSMIAHNRDYVARDRQAAINLTKAAAANRLARIIYLGGLGGEENREISRHLKSRQEVAAILQSGPVPVTVLRAAMILGSGSASFEIMRYLVERLPVMIAPKWVHNQTQPISIRNTLGYLEGCLAVDGTTGGAFDIGGPEVVTYRDLFDIYAAEAGLRRRLILTAPVLSPSLSAKWIHLVTPVPAAIAQPLAEGLGSATVCRDNRIQLLIPQELLSARQTIRLAMERIKQETIDTCWMDAGHLTEPEWEICGDAGYAGGTVLECGFRIRFQAHPEEIWQPIIRIGGETGWYFADDLWRLRGILDRLVGGIGLKRGRRHPSRLWVGDALDFWRVLKMEAPFHLTLLAEMKLPGQALLKFTIRPTGGDQVELEVLSRFLPRGLAGIAYWYVLYPFHEWIFAGMLKALGQAIDRPVTSPPRRFTPRLP